MPPHRVLSVALAVAFTGACQVVWSYGDFKDQARGTAGAATTSGHSATASSTGGAAASSSTGGAPASSSQATASSTGGGGSSSSSGGPCAMDGPDGGACTDTCDVAAVAAHECKLQDDVVACGNNPTCIQQKDGVSAACATCFAQEYVCGWGGLCAACIAPGPDSAGCNQCLASHCDAKFTACSGIIRPEARSDYDASCP